MFCRNDYTTSIDNKCVMDMDINGDIVGCRDLSHLEDCGMLSLINKPLSHADVFDASAADDNWEKVFSNGIIVLVSI